MLTFRDPAGVGATVRGFGALWLKYPRAFNPAHHCIHALYGRKEPRVHRAMRLEEPLVLDGDPDAPFAYLCGVSLAFVNASRFHTPREHLYVENLHVPVRAAPGRTARVEAYNGLLVEVEGAELVPIPALPDRWEGFGAKYTTCRNFQFGAAYLPKVEEVAPAATGRRAPGQGRLF